MARAGREFAKAHPAQFPSQRLAADGHAECFPQPLGKIDQPPANDAVQIRFWSRFDCPDKGCTLLIGQERLLARSLAVEQTCRASCVETQNPVPDDLKADTADLCRHAAAATLVNHRQRKQPTCLRRVTARPRKLPQIICRIVWTKPERCTHGKPPSFSRMNHNSRPEGIPSMSLTQRALV